MNGSAMKRFIPINLVFLLLLGGCASQGEINSLDTRMSELELRNAEARKNSETIKSGLKNRIEEEQTLRQQTASLRAKIDALGEELRILTGRIEELEFSLGRQAQKGTDSMGEGGDIEKLAASTRGNQERILRIEQYLNLESSTVMAAGEKSAEEKSVSKIKPASEVPQELGEDEIYRLAKQAFDQGDSDDARKKFQELIEKYPKSERADNAQFWIGEIYYREKWYEKAILEYQKVIENYPQGNKVPASLLKQGLAFLNLGDSTNSRIILEELIKKYPESNEAKIAKDKLKDIKK
jgi:tol-pal system protein YbgF